MRAGITDPGYNKIKGAAPCVSIPEKAVAIAESLAANYTSAMKRISGIMLHALRDQYLRRALQSNVRDARCSGACASTEPNNQASAHPCRALSRAIFP
jgi:hypothetical protein